MSKPTILKGKLTLTAYGAAEEVGRSAFILEDDEHIILLEAGIKIQPRREPSLAPVGLTERAKDLTAIVLSHAHVDHSGYIPALYEHGFKGSTYMTTPTRDIVRLLWEDQLKIDGRHWSYDAMDEAYGYIQTMKYRQPKEIAPGITIEFYRAGHILGSGMVLINWKGTTILYTGDINDQHTPLFTGFEIPNMSIDVLLTETTNGLRGVKSRKEVNKQFISEILDTLNRGHKVIIPSFAVGRSQELLCVLTDAIKDYPIFVDGMINKMLAITELYLNNDWIDEPLLDRMKKEKIESPFKYNNITQISPAHLDNTHSFRRHLGQSNMPFIILTTSGMMEPSPLHTHLRYAANAKENLIAVTGYQAEGTTGRDILEGKRTVPISVSRDKNIEITINAKVQRFGFSGHTSAEGISKLMNAVKPKKIFLIHGDHRNMDDFSTKYANGIVPKPLRHNIPEILN